MERGKYNRLKIVLAEKDRSSKWLAERMNQNRATVSNWKNNKAQPSLQKLYKLAMLLDVDVKDFLYSTKE